MAGKGTIALHTCLASVSVCSTISLATFSKSCDLPILNGWGSIGRPCMRRGRPDELFLWPVVRTPSASWTTWVKSALQSCSSGRFVEAPAQIPAGAEAPLSQKTPSLTSLCLWSKVGWPWFEHFAMVPGGQAKPRQAPPKKKSQAGPSQTVPKKSRT